MKKPQYIFKNKGIDGGHLYKFNHLTSTNDFIKTHSKDLSHGDVVWAINQTHGKGQLGRLWKSESFNSLTFSILIQKDEIKTILRNISQIAAIALCDLLKEYEINAQIKWPNDVLINKKKIAGFLAEVLTLPKTYLILGIGINLNNEYHFLKSIDKISTSVKMEIGKKVPALEFLEKFLICFQIYFNLFIEHGFKVFFEKWKNYCDLAQKTIQITLENEKKKVQVIKLLLDGGIEVKIDDKSKKIYSGEIFL